MVPACSDVFVAGEGGVHTYRIPAMVTTRSGALLVFCEARKDRLNDASPTDLVLRRSLDGGATWLPKQTLVEGQGAEAVMNPCAIVEGGSGAVLVLCCSTDRAARGEHRHHLLLRSSDEGVSWSPAECLRERVAGYDDTFVPGPGCGVQTRSGRLAMPGYSGTQVAPGTERGLRSRVLYSDDAGRTWRLGQPVSTDTNESQVVELANGCLLLNMRQGAGQSCRAVARSGDGGETWEPVGWDRTLNECPCQASIIRHSHPARDGRSLIVFANPDNVGECYGVERTRMTVRLSYDEAETWPLKRLVHAGPASYSGLVRLENGDVGLVFEGGETHRREWIRFCRLPLDWLEG